ncbi:cell envelope integrity protein TolA [Alkalilimnicola ehrlichii]|uniref:cell envelope integrity protein TolA n=1 Tax=Alkalilimnicola ehrlichii TaxID=351052 RepID=UPI0015F29568|nr:cell envelope integrity protein TolA [Alkalilimnicola ehrlichii]
MTTILSIRLAPDGEVLDVDIRESSGNTTFDRSAVTAVRRASPLPVPSDQDSFEQFRSFNLRFIPDA